nr:uncharacterized protein LOC126538927 isoform X2 [Dermacentor andersoni]
MKKQPMQIEQHLLLTLIFFCYCNCQSGDGNEQDDKGVKAIYVKKLLNGTEPLIVRLSNEGRIDHPICWWSLKSTKPDVGFQHNLTYFRKDDQGRRKRGSWQVRNTTYYVSRKNGPPTIRVRAYNGTGQLDTDVSRLYTILFSSPFCFVMSTPLNHAAPLATGPMLRASYQVILTPIYVYSSSSFNTY